jgi:ribosomal protein S18 acetylase RimI-like enzyme
MAPKILRLDSIPLADRSARVEGARRIFEETAPTLASLPADARQAFEQKYFGIYLETPEFFYLAFEHDFVLGYLAGAPQTLPLHFELNQYLEKFRTEIEAHSPAHLHLNLTAAARGMGLGSRLIAGFIQDLSKMLPAPPGVHIVTSTDAGNVRFYLKNGFEKTKEAGSLLLMGKELKSP